MDLTFQVPMHYCSLQHQTLLLSPVTSTTGYCFCFGSIPSFFLELFLHWSPVAFWAPTDPGSSSFSILSFHLFILFMGFSRQEYWSGLPFPSPVDHILSDLSTMTRPSWLASQTAWLSFIELDKAVVHVIRLTCLLWIFLALQQGKPDYVNREQQPISFQSSKNDFYLPLRMRIPSSLKPGMISSNHCLSQVTPW